ncbi:hypothetical protein GCM10027072_72310 [Streptomyces bullii]
MALTDVLPVQSRPPTSYISLKGGLTRCQCVTSRNGQVFWFRGRGCAALTCVITGVSEIGHILGEIGSQNDPEPWCFQGSGPKVHRRCRADYGAAAVRAAVGALS